MNPVRLTRPTSEDADIDELDDARPSPGGFLLLAVARSYRWILVSAVLGGAVGVFFAAAKPNTYTSEAKLLLRIGAREEITAEDIALPGGGRRESRPTMQDELHMLRDGTIYEGVAARFGTDVILRPADPSRHDGPDTPAPVRWMHALQSYFLGLRSGGVLEGAPSDPKVVKLAAEVLLTNTNLFTERDSNVITVTHTATSPERAQEVTDTLTHAFIERHRTQFSIQSLLGTNRGKLVEAQQSFEDARKRYHDHVQECGFIDLELQGDALMTETETAEANLFASRLRRDEIAAERKTLAAQLEQTPPEIESIVPAIFGQNPLYQSQLQLRSNTISDRDRLPFLGLTMDEQARREKNYSALIEELDRELAQIPTVIVEVPEQRHRAPNPEFTTLKRRIDDLDVTDQSLWTRTRKLDSHLKAQATRMERFAQCKSLHGMMEVTIEAEKERYTQLQERYAHLEALSSIDIEGDTNLRILQAATLPYDKDGPDRKKVVVLGLFAGLCAGFGLAGARHYLDAKLRYPSAIAQSLGVEVLAVVPDERASIPMRRPARAIGA
ncbi:MAG: GumC family protein [Planctomycetota bacterium]